MARNGRTSLVEPCLCRARPAALKLLHMLKAINSILGWLGSRMMERQLQCCFVQQWEAQWPPFQLNPKCSALRNHCSQQSCWTRGVKKTSLTLLHPSLLPSPKKKKCIHSGLSKRSNSFLGCIIASLQLGQAILIPSEYKETGTAALIACSCFWLLPRRASCTDV